MVCSVCCVTLYPVCCITLYPVRMQGINLHTEDLLRDASQMELALNHNLIVFCWGDRNNDKSTIAFLKELGMHAIIYDK